MNLSPLPIQKFFDNAGIPLNGGLLFTYTAGTTTKIATYQDQAGTPNTNPVVLNFRGEANVWLNPTLAYKFVLAPATDTDPPTNPIWTVDNITNPGNTPFSGTDTGSANSVILSIPGLVSLTAFTVVIFKAAATNTGATTITVNGTAKNLTWQNLAAFSGGEIQANGMYEAIYDGTQWQLQGPTLQPLQIRTAAETAAGVTPVNYVYPQGNVLRYGTNTTPGTTNMSSAIQAAINVALVAQSSGLTGIPVYIPSGAYSIGTALTFGGATTAILPLQIYGDGDSTQLINNLTATSGGPVFNFTGKNGWYLHDLLLCGNTVHKNDGIWAGSTGGTEEIRWKIDRVTAMMAGVGLKIADTNTAAVTRFRSWPNNPPALQVAQTVTLTDISHHMYCTGGFVNNITFYDCDCLPSASYASGQRGFKLDCTASYGIVIIGGDYESNGGANTETGIQISPAGQAAGLSLISIYHEGTIVRLDSVRDSLIGPLTDGEAGGSLVLGTSVNNCTFVGVRLATINISDSSDSGNMWIGCTARTTWSDSSDAANLSNQPNCFISCSNPSGVFASRGINWRKAVVQSSGTALALDAYNYNALVVRVTTGSAFTISAPTHVYNGQEITITVRNESGGAMGAITWSSIFQAGWVNPANGFNRSLRIQYDSDFNQWRQIFVGTVDVPN